MEKPWMESKEFLGIERFSYAHSNEEQFCLGWTQSTDSGGTSGGWREIGMDKRQGKNKIM